MSKAMNSPTARLLQSSRLFSLPRPLPSPDFAAVTSVGEYRMSPTATLPYPTRQAITTPPSSLYRGDWGLKRPLPAKTTQRTSTPHVRVLAQDNTEHITSFHSAADHTQTYAKWKEIGLAIGRHHDDPDVKKNAPFESAYDDHVDVIDPSVPETHDTRWKRQGPELESMHSGTFDLYMQSEVIPRKQEFHEFLQNWLLRQRIEEEERKAQEAGVSAPVSPSRVEQLRTSIVTNFATELKRLRTDYARSQRTSELAAALIEFLDLKMGAITFATGLLGQAQRSLMDGSSGTMPTTHPAAGLSYLRSNDVMPNHPLHGPQLHREPVLARVLLPHQRTNAPRLNGRSPGTTVGIGGIVAVDRTSLPFSDSKILEEGARVHRQTGLMAAKIQPNLVGGNKYFVSPHRASVSPNGRIDVEVREADKDAMLIKLGLGHEVRISKGTQRSVAMPPPRRPTRDRIRDDYRDDSPLVRRFNQRLGGGYGEGSARFGFDS